MFEGEWRGGDGEFFHVELLHNERRAPELFVPKHLSNFELPDMGGHLTSSALQSATLDSTQTERAITKSYVGRTHGTV